MRRIRTLIVLAALSAAAACGFGELGRPIDRSLAGAMTAADVAPRGTTYFLLCCSNDPAGPLDNINTPIMAGFTAAREGSDFRIVPGLGFIDIPAGYSADTRSLYAIPGERGRFVLEFTQVNDDQSRSMRATIVERRCQGDTCVLALADSLPINSNDGGVTVAQSTRTAPCDPVISECGDIVLDGTALAAAAPDVAARLRTTDFNRFLLIYGDANAGE